MSVADYLGRGKDRAITARILCSALGIRHRELTKMIEQERRAGAPICASCDAEQPGYYLADGPGELAAYIKSLDRRIKEVTRTRDAMARCQKRGLR